MMELSARMGSMKHLLWLLVGGLVLIVPWSSFFMPVVLFSIISAIGLSFTVIARRLWTYAVPRFFK